MPAQETLTAMVQESEVLLAKLSELGPEDWVRPTNCPPWNVQELVVHIGTSIGLDGPLPPAGPGAELVGAADYYRRPERETPAYRQRNVDQTRQQAAKVLASTSAQAWFEEVCHDTIDTLRSDDLNRLVSVSGRAMRLDDWVVTRVIAVAVHGTDVALSWGRPVWTAPSALRIVHPVFRSLLGEGIPAALKWDDQELLAAAAGRRDLTAREREILGPAADRFPLLS
ncbi:maleylpyruvate isomerase family mycothiol-dependent enzyme [Streptomyces sp. NPDC054863]